MSRENYIKFTQKITNLMTVSAVIWILIIIIQFFVGLITLIFGYGLATWAVMGYNIYSLAGYFKNISYFKNNAGNIQPEAFVRYFENDIPVCWLFMFINLFLGGFIGFVGNLYELILAYYVKSKKGELLMPYNETDVVDDYIY